MLTMKSVGFLAIMPFLIVIVQPKIFEVYNDFGSPIWIGMQSNPTMNQSGYILDTDSAINISLTGINDGPLQVAMWARTYCNNVTQQCLTGSCLDATNCDLGGQSPKTTLQYNILSSQDIDNYAVSVVNGANIDIHVEPINGIKTAAPNSCNKIDCVFDWNKCPSSLQFKNPPIACMSPCDAFHNDIYCCTGTAYSDQASCTTAYESWNSSYSGFFKGSCPNGKDYPADSTGFQCQNVAYFKITFGSVGI